MLNDDQFPLAQFKSKIAEIFRRLDNLERPTGTSVANLVNQVQQAIINIGATVTAYLASGFTTGSMTASGTVTANTVNSVVLRSSAAPTTIISTGRVAGWIQNSDGLIGTQPSSERFKEIVGHVLDDPDFDPFAVLALDIEYFRYKAELSKRDDPNCIEYVGADYKVALNFGPIAEHAHDLGLWMVVIYEHDLRPVTLEDGTEVLIEQLRLDDSGGPIPFGLHESLFGYLLQMAVKRMRAEQLSDRLRADRLAERLAAVDGLSED